MPGPVEVERRGRTAVVWVDNPPVNALGHALRSGLVAAFSAARDDAGIDALVLACRGRTFIAGADITEFDRPPAPPVLFELIALLEAMPKPVVAALHGTALGGGLELALGCHFRVAAETARLGLPEIKLGLLPGAGGTQRLPRLVGLARATEMILSGDPIAAAEAGRLGLVDAVVPANDLVEAAIRFAERAVAERTPLRRVRDLDGDLALYRADPARFEAVVGPLLARRRGEHAPQRTAEALRAAFARPFDEALEQERATFAELKAGAQSRARRHIFFAEREAGKIAGLGADVKPRDIRRAVVLGAGTMGGGIAMSFANAGIPVTIVETAAAPLTRGLGVIEKNYSVTVSRGRLSSEEMERRMARIAGVTDLGAAADADIVVEAVFEEMAVKRDLFSRLDRIAPEGAVLASNTSYLDIDEIAAVTGRPGSVLGMHFFSPANVMRLVEVVRGKATSAATLATALAVSRAIGKLPVVVGVCHGFVGNRMLRVRFAESERLVLEGAQPHEVDAAMTGYGFPMGPFAASDLAGLDISWAMRKSIGVRGEIADRLCEMGRFGQKTGRGYYRYEGDGRKAAPDPEVEALVAATAERLGIGRRGTFAPDEIVERLVLPMANEGARILEEGIAARAGDIDTIWVNGYGWPAWRGGPMFHADEVGLSRVAARLTELAESTGNPRLIPSPSLARLAAEGGSFTRKG